MARTSNAPTNDGMSLLQIMPFTALNPWNWWALMAPQNAMLAAFHTTHTAMKAWRAGADSARALLREQQDALFAMTEEPLMPKKEPAAQKAEPNRAPADAQAADFVTPMLEATRAYNRAGRAFIVAQRNSLRAFAQEGDDAKPH
ncbi:MAG: hypothetical protein R3C25_04495 [Hyphomonadaceae bacterium]